MFASDPEVLLVIGGWAQKTDHDLAAAAQVLKLGKQCPTDVVCFHAEQCVEKYLKALLVNHGHDVPKTHSISLLLSLLLANARPDLTPEEQQRLTDYATVARYPGDYEAIPLAEARGAVKIARRVRRQIRRRLPQAALRAAGRKRSP
jgi:HEPN domain-containing protein